MSFVAPSLPLDDAASVFAVLLLLVLAGPLLARPTRIPDVVVLVLAGVTVGPNGLGLLDRNGTVEVLGGAGVLYLMFLAGLELDLDEVRSQRRDALVFGVWTFVLPFGVGVAGALISGLDLLPAILIGSCWSSHTLLAYPQFRRAGTAGHRVVAATVGATVVTDTAALLVLAVVVRAHEGSLGLVFWLTLVPSFAALVSAVMLGLPRLARAFFAGPGQDPTLRLAAVLAAMFAVAAVTAAIGIEPIVGAFIAGIALNRAVPTGGSLMGRVESLGDVLFVPLFLVATGMLIDPRLLVSPPVLLTGLGFTAAATGGKLLAAVVAGRGRRADRVEVLTMFALSEAQAAATLAAVVVGAEAGLIAAEVVNAVVVVVLLTCVASGLLAARVAPRLPTARRSRPFGATVVAPVADPRSATTLLGVASRLAAADGGVVVPLVIAPAGSDRSGIEGGRALLVDLTRAAQAAGAEARPLLRVDGTVTAGVTAVAAEQDASLVVMGWRGPGPTTRLGGVVDAVLDRVRAPTLVVHDVADRPRRVLVVHHSALVGLHGTEALRLALRLADLVRQKDGARVVVVADEAAPEIVAAGATSAVDVVVAAERPSALVRLHVMAEDHVVITTTGDVASLRTLAGRMLPAVPAGASTTLAVAGSGVRDDGPSARGTPLPVS